MQKLYNTISHKNNGKSISVGIILENNQNEILIVKDKINRINKEIYDIPSTKIKKVEESEIINEINKKYGLDIKNINGYINELNLLDENCNKFLQINVYASINENSKLKHSNYKWEKVENVINMDLITEPLKNCLDIYMYNKNVQ